MNPKRKGLFCVMAPILGFILAAGCAEPSVRPAPLSIRVEWTGTGKIQLDGRPCSLDRLPARLRARGAEPDTPITVIVPEKTEDTALAAIHRTLSAAGFRRVVFSRGRHVTATAP